MATMNRDDQNVREGQPREAQGDVGSPISNEAYNVINALANKLEGLEAYRKYSMDASQQLWKKLSEVERQGVQLLVDELEQLCKDGKLRGGTEKPRVKS